MMLCVRKKAFVKDKKILTLYNKDSQQNLQCSGALAPVF